MSVCLSLANFIVLPLTEFLSRTAGAAAAAEQTANKDTVVRIVCFALPSLFDSRCLQVVTVFLLLVGVRLMLQLRSATEPNCQFQQQTRPLQNVRYMYNFNKIDHAKFLRTFLTKLN